MTDDQPDAAPDEVTPPAPADPASLPADEPEVPWGDFVASLPDDVQARVKGKFDKLDADLRRVRGEKRTIQARLDDVLPKAAERDAAREAEKTAEEKANELANTLRGDNQGLRERLVAQEIKLQAASKNFANPDIGAALLAGRDFLSTDLEPDAEAIRDALDELLVDNPYLVKPAQTAPRPPAPNRAQGTSGDGVVRTAGTTAGMEMFKARRGGASKPQAG